MASTDLFLLSPAHCGGRRAHTILRPEAEFDLARRLRGEGGAELGEVFSFLSGLYFRGKLAYARAFAREDSESPTLVITSGRGLLSPRVRVGPHDLEAFARVPIDQRNAEYVEPLRADLRALAGSLTPDARVVLLGSIATGKYVELLLEELGARLCFPAAFVGMGDMARGALLLRAAAEGRELEYVGAAGAVRSLAATRRPRATSTGVFRAEARQESEE